MRGAVGRNYPVVVQFQNRPVKNESQRCNQVRPHARQQHAGDDDDQRIEEVKRAVPSSGFVDDEADQNQIGHNLQRGLQPVLLPEREQQHIEQRKAIPEENGVMKSRMGSGAGLNWATASSMPSRRVRMKMRTRTSHTSQLRSSNVDCIE